MNNEALANFFYSLGDLIASFDNDSEIVSGIEIPSDTTIFELYNNTTEEFVDAAGWMSEDESGSTTFTICPGSIIRLANFRHSDYEVPNPELTRLRIEAMANAIILETKEMEGWGVITRPVVCSHPDIAGMVILGTDDSDSFKWIDPDEEHQDRD